MQQPDPKLQAMLDGARPMVIPTPHDEPSVEDLAENMPDKEFRALVIMTFRYVRDVHEFCQDLKDFLSAMQNGGGMMGKMMGGLIPPPPPPKVHQQHPHTNGSRRR